MAPTPDGPRLWRWGAWNDPAPTEPANPAIKLLQFNMCGSRCSKGGDRVAEAVVRSVLARLPDVVILNEVCLTQADLIWAKVGERGLLGSGCFGASSGSTLCRGAEGERWFGNAVFTTGAGDGRPELIELPNRAESHEQRNVTAMAATLRGRPVRLASAHPAPGEYNERQVSAVADRFLDEAEEGPVILGGDFNATPDRLGVLYGSGVFTEADDPQNVRTYKQRKIDYLFLSSAHFEEVSGKVTRSAYSDHRPLLGEARFRTR